MTTPSSDWSYEAAVADIEAIVHQLETGELPLSQVFEQFEAAVASLQTCEQFLQDKQQQATILIETLSEATDA